MKNMKRWFCLILTLMILVSMPASAFAGGPSVTPDWESGGALHTHQFLTSQALKILSTDKGATIAGLLAPYQATLMTFSDWPDTYENDGGLYTGHFYNPNTGLSIFNSKTTGLLRFTTHATNAKNYYANSKELCMQELGKALHYLADINEPHHAALKIAVLSNHSTYEAWVDSRLRYYAITRSRMYSTSNTDYTSYCTALFRSAAFNAYAMKDYALSTSTKKWGISATNTIAYAQESMAAFLYYFLYSVGAA